MQEGFSQDRRLVKTSTPGIYKRGGRYVVVYRDPEGKQRKRAARTLAEARELKATLTADVKRGEYPSRRSHSPITHRVDRQLHGSDFPRHSPGDTHPRTTSAVTSTSHQTWSNSWVSGGASADTPPTTGSCSRATRRAASSRRQLFFSGSCTRRWSALRFREWVPQMRSGRSTASGTPMRSGRSRLVPRSPGCRATSATHLSRLRPTSTGTGNARNFRFAAVAGGVSRWAC